MYGENEYESYMRSVLGYNTNQYESDTYFPYRQNDNYDRFQYQEMYPEIYKIVNPMIKKAVDRRLVGSTCTEELLEDVTNEIYRNLEQDVDIVNINVVTTEGNQSNVRSTRSGKDSDEKRSCCQNPVLRDLIKILLLNEIINRPKKPGYPRPPVPPPNNPWPRPPHRGEQDNFFNPYFN